MHLHPASFQVLRAVCSLQRGAPTLSPGSSGSSDPLPGLLQHPCCRTVICLAESVYLWGCNLSRSHQGLGEGSRFDGSSWPTPFPRGLGDRVGALSPASVWGVKGGGGISVVWSRPSPRGRANRSSQATSLPQLRLYLGASHPVLKKASPSAGCCHPATFPDTTWSSPDWRPRERALGHRGHSWQPFISKRGWGGRMCVSLGVRVLRMDSDILTDGVQMTALSSGMYRFRKQDLEFMDFLTYPQF